MTRQYTAYICCDAERLEAFKHAYDTLPASVGIMKLDVIHKVEQCLGRYVHVDEDTLPVGMHSVDDIERRCAEIKRRVSVPDKLYDVLLLVNDSTNDACVASLLAHEVLLSYMIGKFKWVYVTYD